MKYITKLKLAAVHQLCDAEDKSTEHMLQLMQDSCNVDMDACLSYMALEASEHTRLFGELNSLCEVIFNITEN